MSATVIRPTLSRLDPQRLTTLRRGTVAKLVTASGDARAKALFDGVLRSYATGLARAWDDLHRPALAAARHPAQKIALAAVKASAIRKAAVERAVRAGYRELTANSLVEAVLGYLRALDLTTIAGITASMSAQIVEALYTGVEMARSLVDMISEIVRWTGLTRQRATVIAETELSRAYAEGQLDIYQEERPLVQVTALVEYQDARDDRVCPLCAGLHGRIFTVEQARGVIPRHPRCRCSWAAVSPNRLPGSERLPRLPGMP
ncbi:MAG TPA: minor capsid protein [Aquabacterium sp.]|nr:minor capsid protein [Aquabacterium sp.]